MTVKYPNLAAEFARHQIDYTTVYKTTAEELGKSVDTVSNWITGRAGELPVRAAFFIHDTYLPDYPVEYLFSITPISSDKQ